MVWVRDNDFGRFRLWLLESGRLDDEKSGAVLLRYDVLSGTCVWSLGPGESGDEGGGTVQRRAGAADADGCNYVISVTCVSSLSLKDKLIGSTRVAVRGSEGHDDAKGGGVERRREGAVNADGGVDYAGVKDEADGGGGSRQCRRHSRRRQATLTQTSLVGFGRERNECKASRTIGVHHPLMLDSSNPASSGDLNAVSEGGGSIISGDSDAANRSHLMAVMDCGPYTLASGRSSTAAGSDSSLGMKTACGLVVKETICDVLAAGILLAADICDADAVVSSALALGKVGDANHSVIATLEHGDSDTAVLEVSDFTTGGCLLESASSNSVITGRSEAVANGSLVSDIRVLDMVTRTGGTVGLDAAGSGDSGGVANPDDSITASCDSYSMAESYLLDVGLDDEVGRVKAFGGNGPVATSGTGRAGPEEMGMAATRFFVMCALFQILLVGLYCLPLVLPSRVSPTVSLTWENMFIIEFVHRWRSEFCCSLRSLLLHHIKSFYYRFRLFQNWLLAWLILISFVDAILDTSLTFAVVCKVLLLAMLMLRLDFVSFWPNKSWPNRPCGLQFSRRQRSTAQSLLVCHGNLLSLLMVLFGSVLFCEHTVRCSITACTSAGEYPQPGLFSGDDVASPGNNVSSAERPGSPARQGAGHE